MNRWSITQSYLRITDYEIVTDDIRRTMQDMAGDRQLTFDDYGDEVHAFFTRSGRRVRFMNVQLEGESE